MSIKRTIKKQVKRAKAFGTRLGKKAKPYLKASLAAVAGPFGALMGAGGKGGGSEEYRAEAVKSLRKTSKQAGAGQINYTEEVWE